VAKANNQTGLTSGTLSLRACQEIDLGVNRPICPTLPQVALWSPCGAFPAVKERCVAMALFWPWWSLEGSLLMGAPRIDHSSKKEVLNFLVTPQ
jgi:hypothetical protein